MDDGPISGQRVVLARRTDTVARHQWTGAEPDGMFELDVAEGLGARWEGAELVTYDLPGLVALYEYHKHDEYLIDND
jgi:hypothetical protein